MMTDPIANMLTIIRNAQAVGKEFVLIPASAMKRQIADILQAEGFLISVEEIAQQPKKLKLSLKYEDTAHRRPAIRTIRRVSRPGLRVYRGYSKMPVVLNNLGVAIVSTSQGLMTNRDARKRKLGGEIVCEIS